MSSQSTNVSPLIGMLSMLLVINAEHFIEVLPSLQLLKPVIAEGRQLIGNSTGEEAGNRVGGGAVLLLVSQGEKGN